MPGREARAPDTAVRLSGRGVTGRVGARSPQAVWLADYSVMLPAMILGGRSLVFLFWPSCPVLVEMGFSLVGALWWNSLLSLLSVGQHSVMIRRPVPGRLAPVIPARHDGAFHADTSGPASTLVALLHSTPWIVDGRRVTQKLGPSPRPTGAGFSPLGGASERYCAWANPAFFARRALRKATEVLCLHRNILGTRAGIQ